MPADVNKATLQGVEITEGDNCVDVDIVYPDYDKPYYLYIGLFSVRAADKVRIHYDFNRDAWVIFRPNQDGDWVEKIVMPAFEYEEIE